jgi:hypothetical protein
VPPGKEMDLRWKERTGILAVAENSIRENKILPD